MKPKFQKINNHLLNDSLIIIKSFLLFFLLNAFFANAYTQDTIHVSGTINSDTTWGAGTVDTVYVDGDITVSSSAKLTIDPGTVIWFTGYYRLNVDGIIRAVGAVGDTISFTRDDTTGFYNSANNDGGWNGILINTSTSPTDSIVFRFCKIEFIKNTNLNFNTGYKMVIARSVYKMNYEGINVGDQTILDVDSCLLDSNFYFKHVTKNDIYAYKASKVTIKNTTINSSSYKQINIKESSDVYIYNNNISIIANYNDDNVSVTAIEFVDNPTGSIIKNTITNTSDKGYDGIVVENSTAIVDSNTISGFTKIINGDGIHFATSFGSIKGNNISGCRNGIDTKNSRCTISGNTISTSINEGIYLRAFSVDTIENNILKENSIGIGLSQSEAEINNTIINNNAIGIDVYNSTSNITNCLIANNSNIAIYARYSTTNITNSTIANNSKSTSTYAPVTYMSSDGNIFNTIFWGNEVVSVRKQISITDNDVQPSFYYCNIEGSVEDFVLESGVTFKGAIYECIDTTPGFIKPTDDAGSSYDALADSIDWTLDASSPCINSGLTSANNSQVDLQDTIRVLNGVIDLGAYETYIPKTTYGGGAISSEVRWMADTMVLNSGILINQSGTLIIDPGVTVLFTGHYKITCNGLLKAIGTEQAYVNFTIDDTTGFSNSSTTDGGWAGFLFEKDDVEDEFTQLTYCKIRYINYQGQIKINDRYKFKIENSVIESINRDYIFSFIYPMYSIVQFNNNEISEIKNNYSSSQFLYGFNSTVSMNNNTIHDVNEQKMLLFIESDVELTNNTLYNNIGSKGVDCSFTNSYIVNNLFVNNELGNLISYSDPQGTYIANNTFSRNSSANIGGSGALVENNIIVNNTSSGISGDAIDTCTFRNNYISSSTNFTNINCIDCIKDDDPMFLSPTYTNGIQANADTADWSISSLSQAINNGYSDVSNLPSTDLAGNERVNNNLIDIGAYEHQGGIVGITKHPVGGLACEGDSFVFNVMVDDEALYQWYKDGDTISGKTNDTLIITNISTLDQGAYTCNVSNGYGTVSSNGANLFIKSKPKILANPEHRFITDESQVSIEVAVTGTEPISYEWYADDVLLPGFTSATLEYAKFDTTLEGDYKMVVSNTCGEDSTDVFGMYVIPYLSVENSDSICLGEDIQINARAGYSAFYLWFKNGTFLGGDTLSPYLQLNSINKSKEGNYSCLITSPTYGNIFTGALFISVNEPVEIISQPSSEFVDENDDYEATIVVLGATPITYEWLYNNSTIGGENSATLEIESFNISNEGYYKTKVSNICRLDSTEIFRVFLTPKTLVKDNDSVFCEGERTVLYTETNMIPPLYYQWHKNGNPISGQNSDSLIFTTISSTNEGNYYCMVCDSNGCIETNPLYISVSEPPSIATEPISSFVDTLSSFTISVGASGNALSYQWFQDGDSLIFETANKLKFVGFLPTDEGIYTCNVNNSCGEDSTTEAAFYLSPNIGIETKNEATTLCIGDSLRLVVTTNYADTLQWYKNGAKISGETDSIIYIDSVNTSDAGSYTCIIGTSYGSEETDPIYISVYEPPEIVSQPASVFIDDGAEITPTVIASGTSPFTYNWLLDGSTISGEDASSINIESFAAVNEGTYKAKVSNTCGIDSTDEFSMFLNPPIQVKDNDSVFCENTRAVIYTETNMPSPGYQWYKNGNLISGETDDSLIFPTVSINNEGNYYCHVSSALGSITTDIAYVIVNANPKILSEPESKWIDSLTSFTVTVGASGTELSYQWYRDDILMPGETSNQLKFAGFNPIIDEGIYTCVVQNSCGTDTTNDAPFYIKPSIAIETETGLPTLCKKDSLRMVVSPNYTATYQWRKNGVVIDGENDSIIYIASVEQGNAGSYTCYISGDFGNIETNPIYISISETPDIITEPASAFIEEGNEVKPALFVSGTAPIVYMWYYNGTIIPGANSSSLTISSFTS
ncbi:immunoglobulin domain-containing protein, partial [Bacteroidota bacterium]